MIRFYSSIIFLLFFISTVYALSVSDAFVENGLDVDSLINAPNELLRVKYQSTKVEPGMILPTGTPTITPPEVSWEADNNCLYTLVMYDPDVPSRALPVLRSFLHWTVFNIPGSDVRKGETFVPYVLPVAPPKLGFHRYTFLAYKQTNKIDFKEKLKSISAQARVKFSVAEFAQKYNLGDPQFGNFFKYELLSETDGLIKPIT